MAQSRQSAAIPYRIENGDLRILLITSSRRKRWIIPKGFVEPDLDAGDSALKEAYEEAGVQGRMSINSIGYFDYEKWGEAFRVEVFLLEVNTILQSWPEASVRQRRWFGVMEAAQAVDQPKLRELILAVPAYIQSEANHS